jgi:hypothetical protein
MVFCHKHAVYCNARLLRFVNDPAVAYETDSIMHLIVPCNTLNRNPPTARQYLGSSGYAVFIHQRAVDARPVTPFAVEKLFGVLHELQMRIPQHPNRGLDSAFDYRAQAPRVYSAAVVLVV